MIDLSNLISIVAAVISVASVLVSLLVFNRQRRASHFELARSLHTDLTSGEVAMARSMLGTLVHGSSVERRAIDPATGRNSYFTLLWCFERLNAGRSVLVGSDQGVPKPGSPAHFFDEMTNWHLDYWARNLDVAKNAIAARLEVPVEHVSDGSSRAGFTELIRELRRIGRIAPES